MSFSERFPEVYAGIKIDRRSPEALADVGYQEEIALKNAALAQELAGTVPAGVIEPVVHSPLARNWRTTGKRRINVSGRDVYMHMGRRHGSERVFISPLEPERHGRIYRFVHKMLVMPCNRQLAAAMNYCIIRGSYEEHCVIFNMRELSGGIVRALKAVAAKLAAEIPEVRSAFIYLDETGSDYYLESERPSGKVAFKKLYGPEHLALKLAGKKFLYSPVSFSQINESILPIFLERLNRETALDSNTLFLDLYCGYGLWSISCGGEAGRVIGIESAPQSVAAAASNSAYIHRGKDFQYETAFITRESLRRNLPPSGKQREIILLDPPRGGCAPGVLETLIARRPEKILIMFCGADEILPALQLCQANGCRTEKIIPFDFFPGTLNLETLAVLTPPPAKG